MAILEKKNTLIKTITFMSIFAAINIVLSFAAGYIPFLTVLLVILLPLTSAVVEVACDDKYFPIYAFGTLGLCFAVTFWNLDFAIFYLTPSIITGYLFGLMTKKQQKPVWTIFIASAIQTILSFAFIPLMELITERNLINDIISIFGVAGWTGFGDYVILVFFLVSLVQVALSYIAVSAELRKLGFESKNPSEISTNLSYVIFGSILLSILFVFTYKGLAYLFVGISIYFTLFILLKFIDKKEFTKLIIFGSSILVNIFVFAVFNPIMNFGQFLLIQFVPLVVAITSLINFKK